MHFSLNNQQSQVTVIAPARLHMGFIDLSGSLGRCFGSVGLALNDIYTRLTLTGAPRLTVSGIATQRAQHCLSQFCLKCQVSDQLHLTVDVAIPEHVGLGSGTQLSLAVGAAVNEYYRLGLSIREIATIADRGLRSGIGIGIFEQGGFVVDGGRGQMTVVPPVLSRMAVPDAWRFILVFDRRGQGLHGQTEVQAFKQLPPFSAQEAARLCYLLLMQALPALAEEDLAHFGEVITQIQESVGGHFSPAQGGVFASSDVEVVMQWLHQQGAVAIGQTSWGPTGFCVVKNMSLAEQLVSEAKCRFASFEQLSFEVVSARNYGCEVFFD